VINDIKLKSASFRSILFVHVNRACNQVAHVIAVAAVHGDGAGLVCVLVLVDDTPEFDRALICTEHSVVI
jgi:hypothetical protein